MHHLSPQRGLQEGYSSWFAPKCNTARKPAPWAWQLLGMFFTQVMAVAPQQLHNDSVAAKPGDNISSSMKSYNTSLLDKTKNISKGEMKDAKCNEKIRCSSTYGRNVV